MEALSRGEETFNFKQANMAYIRRRMVWEIAHTTLRDE
jgi:sentrin-specific protease 1